MADVSLLDRRPLRRARIAVSVAFLVNGAVIGTWAAHIPLVQERLGLSTGTLGLALLAMAGGAMVAMQFAGHLIHHFGSASVMRVSSLLMCLSLPLPALAPSLTGLVAGLAAFGAVRGTFDVAMNAHAVAVETRYARPVMSSFHGMFSVGGLTGAATGVALLTLTAPTVQVAVVAVLLAAATLAIPPRPLTPAAGVGAAGTTFALPRRGTIALGLLALLVLFSEGAMMDWSAVHLSTGLGLDTAISALGFAAFCATMAIGRFTGDDLRRRFGAVALARGGTLLAAAALGLGLVSGSPIAMVVSFAVAGIGLSNLMPILLGAAGRAPGQRPGTAIAAVATVGYVGFLAGPPLIGHVAELTTLTVALGLVVAACAIVGIGAGAVRRADTATPAAVPATAPAA